MRKVNGYNDFVNESHFELLLEANIQYLPNFKNVLSKINTNISTALINLMGQDVDINTNYIDVDDNKNFIKFVPDDRIKDLTYVLIENDDNDELYYAFLNNRKWFVDNIYEVDNIRLPSPGVECEVVKEFKKGELDDLFTGYGRHYTYVLKPESIFCHVKFTYRNDDGSSEISNAIVVKSSLAPYLANYKTMEFKIGKFASSMLKKANIEFTNVELEDFVNKYKAQIEIRQGLFDKFEIVKGEDIRKYYYHDEYNSQSGTLGNSCMKYRRCQDYLDIYVQNSNVSMIIMKGNYGISGRAILWKDIKGRNIMDRIYTNNTPDEEFFKEFARKNNFYHKATQNYVAMCDLVLNGVIIKDLSEIEIIIQLDKTGINYSYYPFIDTVKFINIIDGTLSNNSERPYDYELESTTGYHTCEECNGNETIDCHNCDGRGRVTCEECEGSGESTCDFCNGEPVTCPGCEGSNPECEVCEGNPICPECEGQEIDCHNCDGRGTVYCDICDYGSVTCPTCSVDD